MPADTILLLSCGHQIFAAGDWKVDDYTSCKSCSQIVGYDPDSGEPEFDRDVKVVAVMRGHDGD